MSRKVGRRGSTSSNGSGSSGGPIFAFSNGVFSPVKGDPCPISIRPEDGVKLVSHFKRKESGGFEEVALESTSEKL